MGGNFEMRLRKLEQGAGAHRLIIVTRDQAEKSETILAAEGVEATEDDLVISVIRFSGDSAEPWPADSKRVHVQGLAA